MTARRSGRCDRREPLARELSGGERAKGQLLLRFRRRTLAAEHRAYRAAGSALAPAGAAPERPDRGVARRVGASVSWLASSMAKMRIFVCALPLSVSARVAREWRSSAGLAGSGELLPISDGRDVAVPRRARARPRGWLPEMREGEAPPGLAVPAHLACPTRRGWSASAGGLPRPAPNHGCEPLLRVRRARA